jgi:hypothetical protein
MLSYDILSQTKKTINLENKFYTRLKIMPTKSFFSSSERSHLVLHQGTWHFPTSWCTQNRLTSQQTPSTKQKSKKHARHNIVVKTTSTQVKTHLKHIDIPNDKSTFMIHNPTTFMSHSMKLSQVHYLHIQNLMHVHISSTLLQVQT